MGGTSDNDDSRPRRPMRRKLQVQQLDVLMGRLEALPGLNEAAAAALHAVAGAPKGAAGAAALCIGLGKVFAGAGGALDREGFWRHCIAVGVCAELIARRAEAIGPPLAFACGLLHDVGKAALNTLLPKAYRRVLEGLAAGRDNIAQAERRRIGADHTLVGRRLGRLWRLPACVEEVIWLHHHSPQALPPEMDSARLIATVQLADAIVRRQGIGFSGNFRFEPTDELARRIGLSADDVTGVETALPAELAARRALVAALVTAGEAAVQLPAPPREPAYPPALAGGKLDALHLLRDFADRVGPATALPELCREMARTYAALLPTAGAERTVAAFVLAEDPPRATVAVWSAGGRQAYRVSPCRAAPAAPATAQPAAKVLRTVLESQDAWADLIELESATCVPLTSRGRWLGGVLIPAEAQVDPDLLEGLSGFMAFVLAGAQAGEHAQLLAERLAQATQHLSQAQQALAEAQALKAVAEMAAGAAHEINTPLAVISGRAQLIAERATAKENRRDAEKIVGRAQDISDIATELLAFARPTAPEPAALDLAELMQRVKKKFLADSQPKTAAPAVDIEIQPSCPPAWADAAQIEQVLVALVANAAEAAAAGSKKVNVLLAAGWEAEAGRVLIRVADDGPGMDEATVAAAFVPFYSRRPAGRGKGMGLAHARRKVQANAGRIWIESRPGKGTTVFVELPRAPRPDR